MRLDDLARAAPFARPLAVPSWTLGCFHRRSITYANGREDDSTRVIWIQSHGLTGDLRIPAARPDVRARGSLAGCTPEELAELAKGEGGVAQTSFRAGRMTWSKWVAFQPYDKWPEPGELRRVGPALVEFAPSGVYVEDWRLQPGSGGLLCGLRLVSEAPPDGEHVPRDGGLVIAGDHAIFALARRERLPAHAPVHRQIAAVADPHRLAGAAFDAQAAYARRDPGAHDYRIVLGVDPFAEGRVLALNGFALAGEGMLLQTLEDGAERRWRVDTLRPDVVLPAATSTQAAEWLSQEADTLLAAAS